MTTRCAVLVLAAWIAGCAGEVEDAPPADPAIERIVVEHDDVYLQGPSWDGFEYELHADGTAIKDGLRPDGGRGRSHAVIDDATWARFVALCDAVDVSTGPLGRDAFHAGSSYAVAITHDDGREESGRWVDVPVAVEGLVLAAANLDADLAWTPGHPPRPDFERDDTVTSLRVATAWISGGLETQVEAFAFARDGAARRTLTIAEGAGESGAFEGYVAGRGEELCLAAADVAALDADASYGETSPCYGTVVSLHVERADGREQRVRYIDTRAAEVPADLSSLAERALAIGRGVEWRRK